MKGLGKNGEGAWFTGLMELSGVTETGRPKGLVMRNDD
jgi:hypothetical protein